MREEEKRENDIDNFSMFLPSLRVWGSISWEGRFETNLIRPMQCRFVPVPTTWHVYRSIMRA